MIPVLFIVAVIIVIFITIILYKNKENFTINTDVMPGGTVDISETYSYPNCTGCITFNGNLKPKFKYLVSDARCATLKSNINTYSISKSELDNLINYTAVPTSNLNTCYNTYNSLYSSIRGKYIILFKPDGSNMKFKHISVHGREYSVAPLSVPVIFTKAGTTSGTFPEDVLNSSANNTFEVISSVNKTNMLVITLSNISDIGYVNIIHANETDAATLNGAALVVLNDLSGIQNPTTGTVVFYTTITGIELNRIIYTYNKPQPDIPAGYNLTQSVINEWTVPCTNCTSKLGNFFQGHKYTMSDGRCFRPTISTSNDLMTNNMSCDAIFETRYTPPFGKFIHMTSPMGTGFMIANIQIYTDFSYNTYSLNGNPGTINLPSFSALVNSYISNNVRFFEQALDNDPTTYLSTNPNSTILINTGGGNIPIPGISITFPSVADLNNFVGSRIRVVSIDTTDIYNLSKMRVSSDRIIVASDLSVFTVSPTVLIVPLQRLNPPVVLPPDLIIFNNMSYDSNKLSTYKRGTIYYQIPYTIYKMSNNRSVLATTLTDSVNTLDKINVSDAVTLFNMKSNPDMTTSDSSKLSYVLQPITARYIKITPATNIDFYGVIQTITLYDSNKNIINTYNNPPVVYFGDPSNGLYVKYLRNITSPGNINPMFVLIDLGINTTITFIKIDIVSSQLNKMNSAVISLININFSKNYNYVCPASGITSPIYLVTDMDEITPATGNELISKDVTYPAVPFTSFAYPECLSSGICSNIVPNARYIFTDADRCFQSNTTTSTCATGCMDQLALYNDNTKNDIKLSNININFMTCNIDPSIETRYLQPVTTVINMLIIAGGGGSSYRAGTQCGGYGGAGEVIEKLRYTIEPGTTISVKIGQRGLNTDDIASTYLKTYPGWEPKIKGLRGGDTIITIAPPVVTNPNDIKVFTAKGGGGGGGQYNPGEDGGSGGGGGGNTPYSVAAGNNKLGGRSITTNTNDIEVNGTIQTVSFQQQNGSPADSTGFVRKCSPTSTFYSGYGGGAKLQSVIGGTESSPDGRTSPFINRVVSTGINYRIIPVGLFDDNGTRQFNTTEYYVGGAFGGKGGLLSSTVTTVGTGGGPGGSPGPGLFVIESNKPLQVTVKDTTNSINDPNNRLIYNNSITAKTSAPYYYFFTGAPYNFVASDPDPTKVWKLSTGTPVNYPVTATISL